MYYIQENQCLSRRCNNSFATRQSLWNYKQRCQSDQLLTERKGSLAITSFDEERPAVEQDVPRKLLWDDCAGLNIATDKTSKNPKIQVLIDEIVNDGSTEDHTTPPEKKSPVDVFGEKTLPLPPPTMVGGVFREELLPKASPPEVVADIFQEKVLPTPLSEVVAALFQEEPASEIESPPRTKGDIIGYSEDSESDESIDINPNVKFLPATVEGLRKRFHELYTEFNREGNTNIETNLCFFWKNCCEKGV